MKIRINLSGTPVTLQVPEGMDPAEYASEVEARHLAQERPNAASDSAMENFAAGVGRGVVNTGRQAVNMALPDMITPEFASDESLREAQARDRDLLDTKAGAAGDLVGSMVATAPLSAGVVGAMSKGARLASTGGNVLTRTLANPAAQAAVDSAVQGALVAGPDNRAEGAASGALISGAMSGAGKILKRSLLQPWVEKTDAAKRLEGATGHSIPLSQSAKPGLWKSIYEGVVANMPGSGERLRGQYDDALKDFRDWVVEEASPPNTNRIPRPSHDMQGTMKDLRSAWEARYASHDYPNAPIVMFSHVYNPPKGLARRLPEGVRLPKPDAQVTGQDVLTLKRAVQDVINELPEKERILKGQYASFRDNLDDVLKINIDPSGRGRGQWARELRDVEDLKPHYARFKDVEAAAGKAKHASEFSPANLEAATTQRAASEGITGGGAFAQEAKDAVEALKDFPSRQGIFQTRAAIGAAGLGLGGAGFMVGGPVGSALALGLPIAASRGLSNPTFQRVIAGETNPQRVMAAALRRNKNKLKAASSLARRASVIELVGEE